MAEPVDPNRPTRTTGEIGVSRRALERLMLGVPAPEEPASDPPAAPAPPRSEEAHPPTASAETPPPVSPTPASPPQDREPERLPPSTLPEIPLALLIAGRSARLRGDAVARAASQLAGGERTVVVVEMDPTDETLAELRGEPGAEGIADVLFFGVSLRHTVQEVPGRPFHFLPAGAVGPDPDAVFRHPRWPRVLAEAERRRLTLLPLITRSGPAVDALARLAGGAVLLAGPDEPRDSGEAIPGGLEVLATLWPSPVPTGEPAAPPEIAPPLEPPPGLPGGPVPAGEKEVVEAPAEGEPPRGEPAEVAAPPEPAEVAAPPKPVEEAPRPRGPLAGGLLSGLKSAAIHAAGWVRARLARESLPAEDPVPAPPSAPGARAEPEAVDFEAALRVAVQKARAGEAPLAEETPASDATPAPEQAPAPVETPPPEEITGAFVPRRREQPEPREEPETPGSPTPGSEPAIESEFARKLAEWLAAEEGQARTESVASNSAIAAEADTEPVEADADAATTAPAAAETGPEPPSEPVVEPEAPGWEDLPEAPVPDAESREEPAPAPEMEAVEPISDDPAPAERPAVDEDASTAPAPDAVPAAHEGSIPATASEALVEPDVPAPEIPPVGDAGLAAAAEERLPDLSLPADLAAYEEAEADLPDDAATPAAEEEPPRDGPAAAAEAAADEVVLDAPAEPEPEPRPEPEPEVEPEVEPVVEPEVEPVVPARESLPGSPVVDAEVVPESPLPGAVEEVEPLEESSPPSHEREMPEIAGGEVIPAGPEAPGAGEAERPATLPPVGPPGDLGLRVDASDEGGTELSDPQEQPAPRYTVPQTSALHDWLLHIVAVLILAYWTYYIGWRWSSTLNLDALWFSVPLVLAETWGLLTAFFLVFTTWRLNHRTAVPPQPDLAVDVFITTYDEPLEVVRRTAISAREIRYPHRTYVLDDGRREEIRSMAEDLGIGYIRRENNEHAKAGNLNNALKFTSGDFILQLDADHAPLPHILDRLLGFFDDPAVAFVQTPQDFYNTDSFTSEVSEDEQRIWEEQRLFFSVIQPGKDSWNSAFFCGSCAVIRRSALEEIGGFSTRSITEDIETSLLLHARGWKSVYYGESLAYGLAAGSAEAFHTQHLRWAQGAMQVLRTFNPLTYPGLSLAQRIGYFYSLSAYVTGLQKLIFYLAPIVFFVTGVLPIRALDQEFLLRFVPYLVLSVALVELQSRGMGFTWIAERYQMAKFWTYTRALPTFLTRRRLRFRVTPKGPGRVHPATYAPHLVLMVLTALSVHWATLAYRYAWVEYSVDGWRSLAFQLNFLWASVNFVLAGYVVRLSMRLQQQRQDHRFADRFPIQVRPRNAHGRLGERQIALTEDLNASGVSFRSVTQMEVGAQLKMTLPLSTREVSVNGTVVHVRRDANSEVPIFVHGVEFDEVSLDVRDAIEIHCAHHAVPIRQMQFSHTADVFSRAHDWVRNARGEPRRRVRLPTWVLIGGGEDPHEVRESMAFLEEISPSGARLIMNEPVAPGTHIAFEVPGTGLRGEGATIFSRALETPIGVRFAVGMRREPAGEHEPPHQGPMKIRKLWQTATTVALITAAAAAPGKVYGQAQLTLFGTAEADTEDQSLLLLGASLQTGREGWQPVAGVLGYILTYPAGAETTETLYAINPSLGVRHQWPTGAVQGTIGYLFLSDELGRGFGAPGGAEQGIVTALMADYWGTGARTAQALASFNWAEEYAWGRVRGAQRVARPGGGDLRLGAELVVQGGGDEPGTNYQALQVGPMVQYQPVPALQLIASAGAKTDNVDLPDRPDWFPYVKFEFVIVP